MARGGLEGEGEGEGDEAGDGDGDGWMGMGFHQEWWGGSVRHCPGPGS